MSNFNFVKLTFPGLHPDCARAESYLMADPRSACFYSRRAVETLVGHLYDLLGLPLPYKNDLAARINDAGFKARAGVMINTKLNLIRKAGNAAVHDQKPIRPDIAEAVLRELHHVMVWAAFHYSANPGASPTGSQFDPKLASQAAPLTRAEVVQLAQKFKAQDEAHAKLLAEKDELLVSHEAELAKLREQVKVAQAANTKVDDHDYTEAQTRDKLIDWLLKEAGWPLDQDRDREFEVTGMPNTKGVGYVDYVLWGADGLPLAVVEAKRTTKSAQIGQQQAKLYADCLEAQFKRRPVIFYSNGYEHWLWDDAAGFPPREVQGFYTRDELELMIQRRHTRLPLAAAPIKKDIVGRYYQERAIKAVGDALTKKQREALLVMATGSGKTRTVIALVDQLMKANWVKRVLFLADRTALVNQAANAFKAHLPSAPPVNLVTEKATDGRVYLSTYPTMMNLINDVGESGRRFGPGYFDLIVIDEAHRSVYAKYGAIFDWFDGLLVGLTATPKDEVDHNTYRLFHLEDGVPTDAYSLDEAVADGFLVPPKGVAVGTKFLRQGIKYNDLPEEEKDQWDTLDWGEDDPPDEVGAEELNRFLFNEDTVDKVLGTLMQHGHKVASGDRLGKTIVFAKNQAHAQFIQQRFDISWPEHAGTFARVITHGTPYAQSLIDDFSQQDKAPHIAISVDMLDTGIDVPEVLNLVFFKMVRSKSKFWQMIGRGTRLRPDLFGPGQDKKDFLVFDFCGNLEYFSQDLPGSEGSIQKSITQRIFEARLGLITTLGESEPDLRNATANTLHEFVAGMNLDNFLIRPHRKWVERYSDPKVWETLTTEDANEAAEHLAGLPSTAVDPDEDAKRFDLLVLRRQLAQLQSDAVAAEQLRETIQNIASALLTKTAIPSVAEQAVLLESVAGDEWWIDVTLPMLELLRVRVRALVRFIEKTKRNPIYTDFEDELGESIAVDLPGTTPGTNFERFRAKAAAYLKDHLHHVALQRLRRNKQLTPEDLEALEAMLMESGVQKADLVRAGEQSGGLGVFIRSLVGLDRAAAIEAFGNYLDGTQFSVDQVRFVQLIVDELTANGIMEPSRLFESPYTDRGRPDIIFPDQHVEAIVEILHDVKAHAVPA
ncbi:DEAD/DEAH box helicase family protein [Hoyosella sp. YIM 151337]|uniref:DEAD/DEAH box helicase family protein n=1 Tax=Hoyosella sp. YIM 151337 TaxID=2992742 RepID=UPI002236850A|nr:DEAD/DEAH box helicase family protein [Hoyosella sp. YIM 151337]MCW4355955.1 DEAD/DEAH box helicase family protein [Hoyosella sp. YIM 151337]